MKKREAKVQLKCFILKNKYSTKVTGKNCGSRNENISVQDTKNFPSNYTNKKEKTNKTNFTQRNYTEEELNKLYANFID